MTISSTLTELLGNRRFRTSASALAAFCGYGAWAYLANMEHGQFAATKAALTQGGYSFAITLSMSFIMETIFAWARPAQHRFAITLLTSCLLLYVTSWGINALLGTPEILRTILPGAVIGTLYTFAYTQTLTRLDSQARNPH